MKLVVIMAAMVCHASGQEAQGVPDSSPLASAGGSSPIPAPIKANALLEAKTLAFQEDYSSSRVTRRMSVVSVAPAPDALQIAHDAALPGGLLVLANGVFTSSSGASVLSITKNITIQALNPGQAVVDGENARRGIHITSGVVVLHGLNVTKGFATSSSSGYDGGGILIEGSSTDVTITAAALFQNAAASGGGIYIWQGTVSIISSTISNNQATNGGGIFINGGTVAITTSAIHSNSAGSGGGIYITRSSTVVSITSTGIYENTASFGGGIWIQGGTLAITTSEIHSNSASNGGGIAIWGGTVAITTSEIHSNSANSGANVFVSSGSICTWATTISTGVSGTISQCAAPPPLLPGSPPLPPVGSPAGPPPIEPPPSPDSSDDGSILELTGTAPKIHFGPEDAPVCSLTLDPLANTVVSSCTLVTPSHSGGGRNLDETEQTAPRVSQAEHDALKTEVAELRRMIHELLAHKK